jgi:pyrroloquinoline quinone (PQQ) biosynthesis protein C
VTATITTNSIEAIEARIAPLRARLTAHPLYAAIRTPEHLRLFMASHVFAVWDFMSLLKALQARLTCVTVPWVPTPLPESRRFLNEIVLGEESDQFEGRAISHFELYLEAMQQAGADTAPIRATLASIAAGSFDAASMPAPAAAQAFVAETFRIIHHGSLAAMAAAFTFGREDVIPDIFRELVRDLSRRSDGKLDTFVWYLDRHIEVDGEDHGPLSLRMVADLCGSDDALWEEAAAAAESAIEARLALWDGILADIAAEVS